MKDFLDQNIEVGDKVVAIRRKYLHLKKGVVTSMATHTMLVDFFDEKNPDTKNEVRRYPHQVIKINW